MFLRAISFLPEVDGRLLYIDVKNLTDEGFDIIYFLNTRDNVNLFYTFHVNYNYLDSMKWDEKDTRNDVPIPSKLLKYFLAYYTDISQDICRHVFLKGILEISEYWGYWDEVDIAYKTLGLFLPNSEGFKCYDADVRTYRDYKELYPNFDMNNSLESMSYMMKNYQNFFLIPSLKEWMNLNNIMNFEKDSLGCIISPIGNSWRYAFNIVKNDKALTVRYILNRGWFNNGLLVLHNTNLYNIEFNY